MTARGSSDDSMPKPVFRRPDDTGARPRTSTHLDPTVYAALDLGTNNCRLLIARPDAAGLKVIDSFSRIVRLGEGLDATGTLSEAAIERTIEALRVCRDKLKARRVGRFRLIATEACRQATNGTAFIARAQAETGLALDVIDRKTEAYLAVSGAAGMADPACEGVVLFDIGGGSTELIWLERVRGPMPAPRRWLEVKGWISLPVGVVTLAERLGGDIDGPASFEACVARVSAMIDAFPHREAIAARCGQYHLLGTSGTVTTVAGVHLGLARYDRRRVDGTWLEAEDVRVVIEKLIEMGQPARAANGCIGMGRADLVLPGCAILEAIRRAFPCGRLRVADRGLREGMLMEMMREDGVWGRRPAAVAARASAVGMAAR